MNDMDPVNLEMTKHLNNGVRVSAIIRRGPPGNYNFDDYHFPPGSTESRGNAHTRCHDSIPEVENFLMHSENVKMYTNLDLMGANWNNVVDL
jgi:hypothetical protein